ncbi:XRE family transcriptional regulator [Clostridium botulinum]|nr:XRE family transcriptional regulator [Clostridium botulinum]
MNTNLLIKFRKRKKYSQEKMAKMLGYKSKGSYSLIESGKTKINIDLANKIVKILDLSSREILVLFFNK